MYQWLTVASTTSLESREETCVLSLSTISSLSRESTVATVGILSMSMELVVSVVLGLRFSRCDFPRTRTHNIARHI